MDTTHKVSEDRLDPAIFKELTEKTPWPWLFDATRNWLVIALAMLASLLINNIFVYIIAIFVIGNRQHGLAILGHDGTHFTLCRSKKLNDAITDIYAFWALGLSASGYRNIHLKHHKHTNTENDPELMHRSVRAPQWDLPITVYKILRYAILDVVGYSIIDYVMILAFAKPDRKTTYFYIAIYHLVITTSFIALGLWMVPLLWYASLATTFMMFFRLRTWLEHQGTDDTHRLHLNWLEAMILAPHDVWHHYEHHYLSGVPYHRLARLRTYLTQKPIMTLAELLKSFKDAPQIRSGQPLKIITISQ